MPTAASPSPSQSLAGLTVPAILVLALLSAAAPLATDMYLPGLPAMAQDLGTDALATQMTLTSFLVGLAFGQLLVGALSDRFGRRRPMLIGTALAATAGVLCALAPDIGSLIALRALQGLGGGAGVVLARATIADRSTDAAGAARLLQLMMVIGGLAPVLAPSIGTGVVALAGWRAVFVVVAALSALAFVGAFALLPESLPPQRRSDGGVVALGRGIASVLRARTFRRYMLTVGFAFMALFAYIAASPFVYQRVLGLAPTVYAIGFGVNAVGIAVLAAVSARLVGRRIAPRRLAAIGLMTMAVGATATLACVLAGAGPALTLPALFLTVAPAGVVMGNATALAITQVPERAGTASALIGAVQFCFGAAASPLVGLAGKDSALPMALTMGAAVAGAALCLHLAGHGPRPTTRPTPD